MEDNSPKKRTEENQKGWLTIAGLMLVLIAIVSIVLFLLFGETRVTGEWSTKPTETATCESSEVIYPIFKYNDADSRSLKIITTFVDDILDSVSLTYQLKYNDLALAEKSDAENQAAMNFSFGDNGFNPNAFDAKYSNINGVFQMTLYAKPENLSGSALKYFLLDGLNVTKTYTQDSIVKAYANRGLNCVYKEIINKEINEN